MTKKKIFLMNSEIKKSQDFGEKKPIKMQKSKYFAC